MYCTPSLISEFCTTAVDVVVFVLVLDFDPPKKIMPIPTIRARVIIIEVVLFIM
jgi:hypothetical protein